MDESAFATRGGLWKGKKGPFATATVIRNTNFTASGRVDYSAVAVLQVEGKQLASRRLLPGDIIIERSGGGPSSPSDASCSSSVTTVSFLTQTLLPGSE